MSDILERDIERRLVDEIKKRGGQCLKWVSPGAAGVPDRIVLMPGGRTWFIELKRPKGSKCAALQTYWARKLTETGFRHAFVHNGEQMAELLREIDEEA